jgi:leader peptidase (prepilin peptidase)/N-methyltransferase
MTLLLAVYFRTMDYVLTTGLWWFFIIWFGIIGGCVASFLNVVWDRLGTGEGFVFPRSRCPECDHVIRWHHNVPVIGWLLLGGRCYDCGARIPVKHPLIEAVFAIAFMLLGGLLVLPWFAR